MSHDVSSRTGGKTQPRTKADRRAAAKAARRAAAERAAQAKRRRQALTGALAGFAVIGVVVVGFVVFGGESDTDRPAAAPATSTAPTAAAAGFPPLPDGADPALGTKPAVAAGSGELAELAVTPLVQGSGPAAQAGQRITVNYVGVSYQTGKEFDASWNRSEPFSFQLGAGNVIPGWDQGLIGAKVGSRVQLDIPSALAYGDNPGGGRPGGPLRFVVDVLAVG